MQIVINSTNIVTFGFSTTFDIANKSVIFNIAALTEFNGSGGTLIQGINFSLNDNSGNPLIPGNLGNGTWDWDNPNILVPSTDTNPDYAGESTFTVDLSAIWGDNYTVLFQSYKIQGAIKDENGTVYQTGVQIQDVCQPKGLTDLGYIVGEFVFKPDCPNGILTIKETTVFAYNGKIPIDTQSAGTLYYPRGTAANQDYTYDNSPVSFTVSPVYTGNYKIVNTTTAQYEYPQDIIVQLEYYTSSEKYDVTCEKHMLSVMCCLTDFEIYMRRYCSGSEALALQAKWNEAGTYLAYGLVRESSGRDASAQAAKIRQILNCNCGDNAIRQISPDPVNPIVYSIVVDGQYGTTVTPTVVGNTKTFTAKSNVYVVAKKVVDLAFTIDTVTTIGLVTYKISFNYDVLAQTLITTINNSDNLLQQFNGLIDLQDVDGKCIITNGANNYFLAQRVPSALSVWTNVVIGSTTYTAPGGLLVSDHAGAESWLNGLGVGVYAVSYSTDGSGFFVNVLSENNGNTPVNALFGTTTSLFQKVTKSLKGFIQSIIDFSCNQDGADIEVGAAVTVCSVDYNCEKVETVYPATTKISELLTVLASVGCDIIGCINSSIAGARNGIVKTVDGSGNPEYRLGTNNLIEDTTIPQNGKILTISNGSLISRIFGLTQITFLAKSGTGGTDILSLIFQDVDKNILENSTNADYAAVSYYAKSHIETNGNQAAIGSHFPNTLNNSNPAPADDPDKTAFLKTNEGVLALYGKAQTVTGDTFTFVNAKPILPLFTTAQRVALTPSAGMKVYDTDFGAEMVYSGTNSLWFGVRYNTGSSKFEAFNGTIWQLLN